MAAAQAWHEAAYRYEQARSGGSPLGTLECGCWLNGLARRARQPGQCMYRGIGMLQDTAGQHPLILNAHCPTVGTSRTIWRQTPRVHDEDCVLYNVRNSKSAVVTPTIRAYNMTPHNQIDRRTKRTAWPVASPHTRRVETPPPHGPAMDLGGTCPWCNTGSRQEVQFIGPRAKQTTVPSSNMPFRRSDKSR